jgi:hypothetical protein
MPAPSFITFKLQAPKKFMRDNNPFYVQKALDGIAGKGRNATRLKNRTLLVDIFNEKQAEVLLVAKLPGSHLVHVERHTSLNSSREIVTDILDGMSDEEIQICLAHPFVSKAYRFTGKRDGRPLSLQTVFLSFQVPTMPSSLLVGYERASVRPYIPNPMPCFQCRMFGHTQQRCASSLVGGDCGERGHGEAPCPGPPHCVNCCGAHASGDTNCPVYRDERAIQELLIKGDLSFLDARKKFLETRLRPGPSVMHQHLPAHEELMPLPRQKPSLPRPSRAPL